MRELKIAEEALRAIARGGSAVPYQVARVALAEIEAVRAKLRAEKDELAEIVGTVTGVPIEAQRATWGYSGGTPPEPAYIEDLTVTFEVAGETFRLDDYGTTDALARMIETAVMKDLASASADEKE